MPSTKVIQNPENFQLSSKWKVVSQHIDKVVDHCGNVVGTGYIGQRFKVVYEAELSESVYKERRNQAILAIIFSFGIAYLCCKNIKSLLAQKHRLFISPVAPALPRMNEVAKEQLQPALEKEEKIEHEKEENSEIKTDPECGVHCFEPQPKDVTFQEAENALNNNLEVPENATSQLRQLLPKIFKSNFKDIKRLGGSIYSDRTFAFSIPEFPDLVFKVAGFNSIIQERYEKTVLGKQAIMKHELNLLEIPDTRLISITDINSDKCRVLVEKCLPIQTDHHFQEDQYNDHQVRLEPIVKQLTKFIYEIGDDHVTFRNYPLLELDGELKCAVIDLKRAGNDPNAGFVGNDRGVPGLIGIMPSEKLIDAVMLEGKRLGLNVDKKQDSFLHSCGASNVKTDRMLEIQAYQNYKIKKKDFTSGNEPIMDFLGSDLNYEQWDNHDNGKETF